MHKMFGLRILNMFVVWRHQPAPEELVGVVKTASKIVGSALTPLTTIYNDRSKKELAILSQTQLTPLIICSDYYFQANVLEASVPKQIALVHSFVYPRAVAALSGMTHRT